ncbi:hypothetical protein LIER_40682 [Lithospermum erythrorhizon]|uniref:PHD-type domain-containing protein n=1 Tax=Lithospermum erythrorhizon TaxID=34254 RepID=A0AAV3QY49_LITER
MRNGLRSRISSKDSDEQKGDGVVVSNVTNEIELKSNSCEGLGPDGSLDAILVPEVGVEEETIACKAVGVGKKDYVSVPVGRVNANGLKVDGVGANSCDEKKVDGFDARNSIPEQADGLSTATCIGEQVNSVDARNSNLELANGVSSDNYNGEQMDGVDTRNSNLDQVDGVSANNGEQVDGFDARNSNLEKADGVSVDSCNGEQVVGVDSRNSNLEKADGVSADTCNGEQVVGVHARNSNLEQADGVTADNCNGEQVDGVDAHNSNLELADGASADNCNEEQGSDGNANNRNGEHNVQTKGRRGRKRKNTEMSSNVQMTEMFDLNEMPVVQLSGRVLRSRTVAVRANDLIKGELNDVVDDTVEGIEEVDNKRIKLENSEKKGAEPSRGGKKKKGLRGRPPKVNKENRDAAVIIGNKYEALGSKVSFKSDTSVSKLKGQSVASEKKDIRKKIVDIVVQCGWEIQLVPRASRDYNDPVYVDPEGRTHWSITKAYKILKERIDSGVANDVERAGFTEIPDETLSKLFRIATKKRSDCGVKRSEGVEEKEPGMNRSSGKKTDDSNFEDKSNVVQKSCGRKRKSVSLEGRKKRRFALLARGSGNKSDPDDDESELYNKKRNLLSWMIDLGTVTEGENVHYRDPVKGAALLEGKVTSNGLSCNCCDEMHTILGFQLHAGIKSGEPLKNIYLLSGSSLFQCMENSWTQQLELSKIGFCSVNVAGSDHNDDTCNICGDGGNLMCCDCCPSTFHLSCLDIENVPDGDWHCMYCTCKFCKLVNDEALSQDDGNHILTCQLCEEKFHATCPDQTDAESMNSSTTSFCGVGCLKVT